MKTLTIAFVLTLMVALCATAHSDMDVYVVEPVISNRHIIPGQPLPETCRLKTTLTVAACRGEYEPASFVVKSDAPLKAVQVKVGKIAGPAGTLPASAIDIRALAPFFRRITDYPGLVPWVLVHDPALLVVEDKPQPQAMKPDAAPTEKAYIKTNVFTGVPVDADTLQPADIDGLRQFWLTVRVPANARAGTYTAPVTITAANAPAYKLKLVVQVYPFDLKPPKFEYSVYYPAWIEGGSMKKDNPQKYAVINDDMYLAEMKNMVAHGCTNPTIYDGPTMGKDGKLDFSLLERVVRIRQKAGMRGGPMYLLGTGPVTIGDNLSAEQLTSNTAWVREIVQWAKGKGFTDVYFYGVDEATGDKVKGQRAAMQSVHEGGGKVFVANYGDFYELVGDLLDLPILLHPTLTHLDKLSLMPAEEFLSYSSKVHDALDPNLLMTPHYQNIINGVHKNGFKIFTYMDPLSGYTLPFQHRLFRGFGLWKAGMDGTMTWSYTHITEPDNPIAGPIGGSPIFNFVLRGKTAPFDTPAWEAYREGHDDARYLATLEAAMTAALKNPSKRAFVKETQDWLGTLNLADLDPDLTRWEIARRIEVLQRPAN